MSNDNLNQFMIDAQKITFHHQDLKFEFACQIKKGDALAILGSNGAGKSTFLKLVAGFLNIESGTLLINGVNCTHLPANRRSIGFLFQDINLFDHLTVEQNLSLALSRSLNVKSKEQEILMQLVQEMKLQNLMPQKVESLSDGQKQKIALARVLLQNHPILLLDEPFSALDKNTKKELLDLLFRYQNQKNLTIMMITHHLDDLVYFKENILRIENGKILPDNYDLQK